MEYAYRLTPVLLALVHYSPPSDRIKGMKMPRLRVSLEKVVAGGEWMEEGMFLPFQTH